MNLFRSYICCLFANRTACNRPPNETGQDSKTIPEEDVPADRECPKHSNGLQEQGEVKGLGSETEQSTQITMEEAVGVFEVLVTCNAREKPNLTAAVSAKLRPGQKV